MTLRDSQQSPSRIGDDRAVRVLLITTEVRELIAELTDHYRDFVAVVKAENHHLQEHGPYDLEEIIRQKTAIGQSLELAVTALYHSRQQLRKIEPISEAAPFTLSGLFQHLETASAQYATDTKLQDALRDTRAALSTLLDIQKQSDKWIKLNAFVIEKMLEQHSQVIDLWQSVIDNSESTYSQKGVKAGKGSRTSVLRAKA